jgi:ribose 5-phosphate isomerase B
MKIALGSDHAGYEVKQALAAALKEDGHEIVDCGCHSTDSVDYPDLAHAVAEEVAKGNVRRGILVCGTGIGMCMAANRHPGVRAANPFDAYTTEMSREHNDANVLCLGARVLKEAVPLELARLWLRVPFGGERHEKRVKKIDRSDLAKA